MWSYQHENFIIHQLPVLSDNYIYLIEAKKSDALIAVDPALAAPVREACQSLGKPLTHIFNTHHHWDHTDGNLELKRDYGCQIIGASHDAARIPGINIGICESTPPEVDHLNITVIDLPGHTSGHIAYLIGDALFCGDTLFGAGCGRLFEGTATQMWQSLNKLAKLNEKSRIYCAHEYTMANLTFAHAMDPDNQQVDERINTDSAKRHAGLPTIPSTIGLEKATNPFLRPLNPDFCSSYAGHYGIDNNALTIFTHLRTKKDHF